MTLWLNWVVFKRKLLFYLCTNGLGQYRRVQRTPMKYFFQMDKFGFSKSLTLSVVSRGCVLLELSWNFSWLFNHLCIMQILFLAPWGLSFCNTKYKNCEKHKCKKAMSMTGTTAVVVCCQKFHQSVCCLVQVGSCLLVSAVTDRHVSLCVSLWPDQTRD